MNMSDSVMLSMEGREMKRQEDLEPAEDIVIETAMSVGSSMPITQNVSLEGDDSVFVSFEQNDANGGEFLGDAGQTVLFWEIQSQASHQPPHMTCLCICCIFQLPPPLKSRVHY